MKIVTGSEWLDEPKDPEKCNVFALIKFFASKQKQDEIAQKYREGGYWYWHAKLELLDLILDYFKEAREKYNYYMENFSELQKRLEAWNKKVNKIATEKYKKMMEIVGL
jgi:tryptophanyl-tRNA synthetase